MLEVLPKELQAFQVYIISNLFKNKTKFHHNQRIQSTFRCHAANRRVSKNFLE